ncbi:hypothetical protein SAMN05216198_1326 [Halopseudomonas litoralis]|uniref:Uncharacterized protein n=1 Tax=Halopseudomonas litoralis TaxID=797277 RepID=A0A1H1PZZ3_9GAMM|nr:hypothetical protein [Halopseudomonas litoralis]SDS16279.1 hypothetical protein SAMN05216198_1326 [Halopseudomonas litoralis]
MDQSHTAFPIITLPSVDGFVETIGEIFCVGRTQSEKLSLARSYSTKQNRYQALIKGRNSLLDAMVGRSIYDTEEDVELKSTIERHFGHMQQLVSWIRASPMYEVETQGEVNQQLTIAFAAPQLAILLTQIEPMLKDFSPLKYVDYCLGLIIKADNEPVRACQIAFRDLLALALKGKKAPDLSIRKNLNSLDTKTSKFSATQISELITLDRELGEVLKLEERKNLIDKLTGIYSAFMAFNRLKKIMDHWSIHAFSDFAVEISEFMSTYGQVYSDDELVVLDELALLNDKLIVEFYRAENPSACFNFTLETCKPYISILSLTSVFSPPSETIDVAKLLKKGALISDSREYFQSLKATLFKHRESPYFEGANNFLDGILALYDGDRGRACAEFQKCLSATRRWPLGVLENQAALFCIGLAMSDDPGKSVEKVNPLLAIYLESSPQLYIIQLPDSIKDVVNYNLQTALIQYNQYCLKLDLAQGFIFNPLKSVEKLFKRVFDWIDEKGLGDEDANIVEATREVTNRRDVQRVRPYLVSENRLIDWLASDSVAEAFQYFPTTESLKTIPNVCRLFSRGSHYPSLIARELDRKTNEKR